MSSAVGDRAASPAKPEASASIGSTARGWRRRGRLGRWPPNQLDQAERDKKHEGEPDDHRGGWLAPEDEDQHNDTGYADPESLTVRVGPPAHGPGPHAIQFAMLAQPAQAGRDRAAGPDSGDRGSGEEGRRCHD